MITTLNLNPSIIDQDELFDSLVAQFEEIDEALSDKVYQGIPEEIDAHESICDFTNDYHDGEGNWGRMTGQNHIFVQSGECVTLVIEQEIGTTTVLKAWYTDNWEDLENL